MSKNGNGKVIHNDNLRPSTEDCKALVEAIEDRFLTVCELYGRKWGGQDIPISKDMQKHIIRWRQVVVRHRQGDYRNTQSEWNSMREVAQWTVTENCKLRGQKDRIVKELQD